MKQTIALLCILCAPLFGGAHDLWLLPPEKAEVGKPVRVRAAVGMEFPKSELAHDTSKYPRLAALGPAGKEVEVRPAGKEDNFGLIEFTPSEPGIYVVGVQTSPKVLRMEAAAFNEYLVSDGLPHIYRLRAKEKSLDQPAVERYSKSPRVLIVVGDKRGAWDRRLKLPLEIVPQGDPFALKAGQALRVRVLHEGTPLADAHLGWDHPDDGEAPRGVVRTSKEGEALIPIAQTGLMTIRLTHMTRPKTADYEWESFWTTLTFVIP